MYGEAPKELYLSKEQKVKKMSEIVPNGYTKIDYQKKADWQMDIEFNPFNWKHNAFLAMHHIEYLSSRLKIQDEIIMAYNCGEGAVMRNEIPESTKIYLSRVKNNLKLLNNLN